jgi:hypothetical protein
METLLWILEALEEEKKNPVSRRNAAAIAHSMRGGAGAGKHKNKGDFERGKARHPKHKGKVQEALEHHVEMADRMEACEAACNAVKAAVEQETLSKETEKKIYVVVANEEESLEISIRILHPGDFFIQAGDWHSRVEGNFEDVKERMMEFMEPEGYFPMQIRYGDKVIWEAE